MEQRVISFTLMSNQPIIERKTSQLIKALKQEFRVQMADDPKQAGLLISLQFDDNEDRNCNFNVHVENAPLVQKVLKRLQEKGDDEYERLELLCKSIFIPKESSSEA